MVGASFLIFIVFLLLVSVTLLMLFLNMRRAGTFLIIGTVLLALLVGNGLIPSALLKNLQVQAPLNDFDWKPRNTIILLGGGLVSWAMTHHVGSTLFGYSRLHEAARLYFDCKKKSENCIVLASGGDPQKLGISEAEVMKRELLDIGIPESNIILEQKSNNTYQNAQFSSVILRSQKNDTLVLVSSGGHMRRSLLYFSHFGVNAVAAPSDQLNAQSSWLPLSYNFLLADLALHEYVGIIRFHLYNYLGWNRGSSAPGASEKRL